VREPLKLDATLSNKQRREGAPPPPSATREEVYNMTIHEAIAKADRLRDNTMTVDDKIATLENVDRTVYEELIRGREGQDQVKYPTYTKTDLGKELLVPSPYDMLYVYRLEAEVCYVYGETKKQANALIRYNELISSYAAKYIREHRQVDTARAVYY
jgi:hypothetical protein